MVKSRSFLHMKTLPRSLVLFLLLSSGFISQLNCLHDPKQSLITTSRVYLNASETYGESISQSSQSGTSGTSEKHVKQSRFAWLSQDDVQIVRFLDCGRFSNVFEGLMNGLPVVLKVLKPTFMSKIKREIKMLEILKGVSGVIQLYGATKNTGCRTVSLVFENIGSETQWLSHRATMLSSYEIQIYCYKLLKALDSCHARGIMHRDIKPRNVLYHRPSGEIRIIDLGLSDQYTPATRYNPSVASRHYKCPELLFEFSYYDYSIDIWSAGCLFAGLIFNIDPFFNGSTTLDQIKKISRVVGSEEIYQWAKNYNISLTKAMKKAIGSYEKKNFIEFRNDENYEMCPDEAIDLLTGMLRVDHQDRSTAADCLAHPYFDDVRHLL